MGVIFKRKKKLSRGKERGRKRDLGMGEEEGREGTRQTHILEVRQIDKVRQRKTDTA